MFPLLFPESAVCA